MANTVVELELVQDFTEDASRVWLIHIFSQLYPISYTWPKSESYVCWRTEILRYCKETATLFY